MLKKIREELQQVLKNEPKNHSKILDFSNQLSKVDKNNMLDGINCKKLTKNEVV